MRLELHVPDPAAREGKGRSNDFPALLQDPCTGDSCSSCDGRRCALQFVMIGPDTYGARRCRGDYAQRGGGRMSHTHARGVSLRMARLDYSIYVLYRLDRSVHPHFLRSRLPRDGPYRRDGRGGPPADRGVP